MPPNASLHLNFLSPEKLQCSGTSSTKNRSRTQGNMKLFAMFGNALKIAPFFMHFFLHLALIWRQVFLDRQVRFYIFWALGENISNYWRLISAGMCDKVNLRTEIKKWRALRPLQPVFIGFVFKKLIFVLSPFLFKQQKVKIRRPSWDAHFGVAPEGWTETWAPNCTYLAIFITSAKLHNNHPSLPLNLISISYGQFTPLKWVSHSEFLPSHQTA